jgi:hypothetical protein
MGSLSYDNTYPDNLFRKWQCNKFDEKYWISCDWMYSAENTQCKGSANTIKYYIYVYVQQQNVNEYATKATRRHKFPQENNIFWYD